MQDHNAEKSNAIPLIKLSQSLLRILSKLVQLQTKLKLFQALDSQEQSHVLNMMISVLTMHLIVKINAVEMEFA